MWWGSVAFKGPVGAAETSIWASSDWTLSFIIFIIIIILYNEYFTFTCIYILEKII